MPDNKTKTHPLDSSRINVNESHEVKYWTKELGVTKEQLQEAVNNVGTSSAAVRDHLKMNGGNKA